MTIAVVGLAFTLLAAQAPDSRGVQPAAGTARVRGTVAKADTGGPLPRVAVRLTSPRGDAREAASDTVGRFEFSEVPPGRYLLSVAKAGYVNDVIEVTVTGALDDLVVRMAKGGAVAGRIVDDIGEPVVEARVRALRSEYVPGGRRLTARHAVQTNDLGEYRLYGLPPGIYYIVANTSKFDLEGYDAEKQANIARGGPGFAPTFFPGSALAADAQPVTVRGGTDVLGIDFALRSVRLARLSGSVVDSRGRPAADTVVMLNVSRTGGAEVTSGVFEMGFVAPAADGSFVLSNVKPGEYRLDVYSKAAMEAIARSGSVGLSQAAGMPESASVPISVSGEDIENVRIVTTPGRRLAGRISVDGAPAAPEVLNRLKIWTVDRRSGLSVSTTLSGASAIVQPDGTFEVRGVSGTRAFDVNGLPPGWALKSVRTGGMDVTDSGVELRDADLTDLEVSLTAKPAAIAGTVVDGSNRPVGSAAIIVFPEDRGLWASPPNRHLASVLTASDGSFEVSSLPAGEYLVALVDDLVDGEWGEAEKSRASARLRAEDHDRRWRKTDTDVTPITVRRSLRRSR